MYGKPMVSCEISTGTTYINANGVTGWTVPPEDAGALRAAMHRLLDDPQDAARMGAAARERFERLFTAQRMAQAYHDTYREVVDSARR